MKKIKFVDRYVGDKEEPLIIAEAGVNHNGNLELAKKLVDAAVFTGADVVKFQYFIAERLTTKEAGLVEYQKSGVKEKSQFDMLKSLELKPHEYSELFDYCNEKGIIFLCTPFDESTTGFLNSLGMKFFKVGSTDTNNLPYLEHMAKMNKPIVLSAGMTSFDDIKESVEWVKKFTDDLVVLHCTTAYPTKLEDVNLSAMKTLREKLNVLVGYSDHTPSEYVSALAVAEGACIIEKHLTLDNDMEGPDHKASLNPEAFKRMVENIKEAYKNPSDFKEKIKGKLNVNVVMGSANKVILQTEAETAKIARKSVVAARDIPKGWYFTREDLATKRPGTGLKPKELYDIIGKKATRDLEADTILSNEDFE